MSCSTACSTTTGAAQQLFATAVNFFAASQCFISKNPNSEYGLPDLDIFDYIVVGAGSAGCVVASRLSEISDWKVLLLEAGLEPPIESDIPYLYPSLTNTKYDWSYIPKNNGVTQQALKNGAAPWKGGKMLGGSSSINYMMYVTPRDCDIKAWSDKGNPSWSVENAIYYTKKAENFQDMTLNEDPLIYNHYGHSGPLVINSYNYSDTITKVLENVLDSWNSLEMTTVPDTNSAYFQGSGLSGIPRVTAKNGQRQSTYNTYIKPFIGRDNLKVITNAFVTKILLNDQNLAYGIEVDINGKKKKFYANIEVVLSAGSIHTPQLLMLSGIGPQEHLQSKNITCAVNLLGVGDRLQDHLSIYIPIYTDEPKEEETLDEKMFGVIEYLHNKTGYLAHATLPGVISFFSRNKSSTCPEFQTQLGLFPKNSSILGSTFSIFNDDVAESILKYNPDRPLYLFTFNLLHPASKGKIYLNTSNPYDHPIIEPNYLEDERDVIAAVEGIKMITNLVNTPYFKRINAFIPRANIAQCNEYEFLSDLYWRCYAIHMTATIYHPVGTSTMGLNKNDSVVNNFLEVHGVKSLRVIDASIMPGETSGNIISAVIMVAEFGSDMIKADHLTYNQRKRILNKDTN